MGGGIKRSYLFRLREPEVRGAGRRFIFFVGLLETLSRIQEALGGASVGLIPFTQRRERVGPLSNTQSLIFQPWNGADRAVVLLEVGSRAYILLQLTHRTPGYVFQ